MRYVQIFFAISISLMLSYQNLHAWATENQIKGEKMNSDLHSIVTNIQSVLVNAGKDMHQQAWQPANTLLKKGLAELGDRYLSNNIIDDTGMKLIIAQDQENRGDLENAAKIRYSMLNTRLNLLKEKLQPSKDY